MKRILNRLRSKRGETLVEVMASILIFTLSSILLYSMITTANRINAEVRDTEQAQQENLMFAQKAEGDGEAGTISLSLTRPDGTTEDVFGNISVRVFRKSADSPFYTFFADEAE